MTHILRIWSDDITTFLPRAYLNHCRDMAYQGKQFTNAQVDALNDQWSSEEYIRMADDSPLLTNGKHRCSVAWMVAENIKDTLGHTEVGYYQSPLDKDAVY